MGGEGDDYIDFGTYEARDVNINPETGQAASLLLDFNVDGVVWDSI